jgi:NADH dehydrogenase (ubiquinone) 1 beta subcomplex subunit 10
VEPNQKQYNWYHRKFRRVPTIDECFADDKLCIYEANSQYKRDRLVDSEIVSILRMRMDDCVREEYPDHAPICFQMKAAYEKAAENWFIKCKEINFFKAAVQ